MTTWNAQALMTSDANKHLKKWRVLQRLATRSDVVCVQETHDSDAINDNAAARLSPTHRAFHSVGRPSAAGGLLTLVKHSLLVDATVDTEVIQEGRILVVHIAMPRRHEDIAVVNLHNHDVSTDAIRRLSGRLTEWTTQPRRTEAFILGDRNFPEHGSTGLTTSRCGTSRPTDAGHERRRWRRILRLVTEITHNAPTRAALLATRDGPALTHNSLDMMATTLRPTTLAMTRVQVSVGWAHHERHHYADLRPTIGPHPGLDVPARPTATTGGPPTDPAMGRTSETVQNRGHPVPRRHPLRLHHD